MNRFIFSKEALWQDAISLVRIWCGVIFIRYGLSLFSPTSMADFASTLEPIHIPFPVLSAHLCKATEFIGGLLLVIGFLRRPAALLIGIDMVVATFVFHKGLLLRNGMTTFTLLLCCIAIFLLGADRLSLDRLVSRIGRASCRERV